MKKIISVVALLALCLSLFAGCGEQKAPETTEAPVAESALKNAKEYLFTLYKDSAETTPTDNTVVGAVKIGTETFQIDWTADSDTVKFVRGEDNMVTVDVDEKNPEEVTYVLTGTMKDAEGNTESVTFTHRVPAAIILDGMSYEEIVAAAYALEDGLSMTEENRLFGKIVKIDTPYDPEHKNITVTIQVGELAEQPIMCFRLSGEGVEALTEGDEITVQGTLKNYKGTIEFDKGCQLIGMGEHIDQSKTLEAAYKVEPGVSMNAPIVLQGVITESQGYNEQYKNVTLTMVVDGIADKPIVCFRMSGAGVEALEVGATITVAGTIKNHEGTIEFDQGCKLIPNDAMKDAKSALAAYALEDGLSMNAPATMTGVITEAQEYNDKYKNITVTIVVAGLEEYPIVCYHMGGEGVEALKAGDIITVTGTLKNYKGTIEFDQGCTKIAVTAA